MTFYGLGESSLPWVFRNAKYMAERGHTSFVLIPTTDEYFAQLPQAPGVFWIPLQYTVTQFQNSRDATHIFNYLHPREGLLSVDVVYSEQIPISYYLATIQSDCNPYDRLFTYLDEGYVQSNEWYVSRHTARTRFLDGDDRDFTLADIRAMAYATADRIVIPTSPEKKYAVRMAKRVFSGAVLKRVLERMFVAPNGIDLDLLDEIKNRETTKYSEFTVFFGGRLNYLKAPEVFIKAIVQHIAYGRPTKVIITSPKQDYNFWRKLSQAVQDCIEFTSNTTPMEFFAKSCRSHVAIYPSKGEGFSTGVLEMVYSGAVVLLPQLEWVDGLFPEGYPFRFHYRLLALTIA